MKTIKLTVAAMLAAFTASCAVTAPAFAQATSSEETPLCYSAALAGPKHTINPYAPKNKQVQERVTICDFALVGSGKDRHVEPLQQPLIVPPTQAHPV